MPPMAPMPCRVWMSLNPVAIRSIASSQDVARHSSWIESRIEEFETSDRFAGIVCWDALFHIDRAAHHQVLARVANLLSPGGRLMLTVGGSEHPAFTDTMFGREFFYDSHPPERALELLAECGFVPLLADFINEPTGGRDKGRYAIVAALPA